MRLFLKFACVAVVGFVTIEMVSGQQQGGILGQFGGLFGGKQQPPSIESLLANDSVKKELKLTDEQTAKIPSAVLEALAKVLDAEQLKRFKQIELQQRDYKAFGDPNIQATLKMTDAQKGDIKILLDDADKETQKLTGDLQGIIGGFAGGAGGKGGGKGGAGGGFGGFQGMGEKVAAIAKDTKDKCQEVLTAEQRRTWNELLGDEFKLDTGNPLGGIDLKGLDLKNLFKKKGN